MSGFDFIIPDGISIKLLANFKYKKTLNRIPGPDFMEIFLSEDSQLKHYFLGSKEKTLNKIIHKAKAKNPKIRIVGSYSPPFKKEYNHSELQEMRNIINEKQPDIIWVGLGCPKQEKWIIDNKDYFKCKAILGVGAAFDFYSGNIRRAPKFLRVIGLEFIYRLVRQPVKTFPRIFVDPLIVIKNLLINRKEKKIVKK